MYMIYCDIYFRNLQPNSNIIKYLEELLINNDKLCLYIFYTLPIDESKPENLMK